MSNWLVWGPDFSCNISCSSWVRVTCGHLDHDLNGLSRSLAAILTKKRRRPRTSCSHCQMLMQVGCWITTLQIQSVQPAVEPAVQNILQSTLLHLGNLTTIKFFFEKLTYSPYIWHLVLSTLPHENCCRETDLHSPMKAAWGWNGCSGQRWEPYHWRSSDSWLTPE
jgi:hypothetical protein